MTTQAPASDAATGGSDPDADETSAGTVKVDVWSDVACPWCYVGKRKFEAGAAEFTAATAGSAGGGEPREVVVEFHSYELAPDTPVGVTSNELDYLVEHLGISREQGVELLARMVAIGKTVGIDFDYDALQHTNTVKAHQLVHYAKAHGQQAAAAERVYQAYFVEGRDVGRADELADLAAELGLDRADALRSLDADEFLADVRADQALAQQYGIRGVPFFVIDGKYGVSGAQDPTTFTQVLERAWSDRATPS